MQVTKKLISYGFLVFASVVFISGNVFAQETTDYNDALKQQLKAEDAPVTPPKKVVHKKIRKADSQSAKVAAQKKAMAKNVKVAQTESTVSDMNVETVRTKHVQPASDENLEDPTLGGSAVLAAQPAPYQPIFILQPTQVPVQQAPAAPVMAGPQVQPTTNVDSTSVAEPRSEQLRRQREDLEHQTESKLIEKLEDDRLSSEKDRANRIFAAPTPVATPSNSAVVPVVPPVAAASPAPAPVVAPVTAVEVATPAQAVSAVPVQPSVQPVATPQQAQQVEEIKNDNTSVAAPALVGETKTQSDDKPVAKPDDEKRFSVGAVGGLPSYPGVANISSFYALGALADYKFADHLSLQSQFIYSKYNITNAYYCYFCSGGTLVKGLNQYDVSFGLNYKPFTFGSLTPVGGVVVDYARRNYFDVVDYGYTYGTPTGSNAFNAGVMLGLDLNVSKNVVIGAQFSYLWNISYWTDDPLAYGLYGPIYGSPVESLSYYLATLNVRFMF